MRFLKIKLALNLYLITNIPDFAGHLRFSFDEDTKDASW